MLQTCGSDAHCYKVWALRLCILHLTIMEVIRVPSSASSRSNYSDDRPSKAPRNWRGVASAHSASSKVIIRDIQANYEYAESFHV